MTTPANIPGTGTGTTPKGQETTDVSDAELNVLSEGDEEQEPQGLEEGLVVDDEEEETEETTEETTEGTPSDEETEGEEEEVDLEEEEEEEETEEEGEEGEEPDLTAWQELKAAYPKLAKDRQFKQIFFGYKAFTEVFPGGVQEARETEGKARNFDALDTELGQGNVEFAFQNMNKESLGRIAKNFLPSLYKFDKESFAHATRPLIIDILNNIHDSAVNKKDDNLRKSVRNISNYLFDTPDIPKREVTTGEHPEVRAERERLQEERRQDFLRDQKRFLTTSDSRVGSRLTKIVQDSIDPKNEFKLTEFAKNAITERVLKDVRQKLESNEGIMRRMQSLHQQAARSNFPDELVKKIASAYLGPAKRLIPGLIIKHRNAALGKTTPKGNNKHKVVDRSGKVTTGGKGGERVATSRSIDMNKTSPEDYLAGKVVYKNS